MPDQPRFVTQKIFKFRRRVHGPDDPTLVVTEELTPTRESTITEQAVYTCGHRVDVAKAFVTKSDAVVCSDCLTTCSRCHAKIWIEEAFESVTGDWYCQEHRGWAAVKFFEKLFFKK